jgi:5-formyltetrahydrofolate cyclo-ligase
MPLVKQFWSARPTTRKAYGRRSIVQTGSMSGLSTNGSSLDELIRTAIEHRRLIRFRYHDKDRIVEPHDYGVQNGSIKLLGYQVGGSSRGRLPNWRWWETAMISDLRLLDKTFPGGRPTPSAKHHKWDVLFIRVKSTGASDKAEIRSSALRRRDALPPSVRQNYGEAILNRILAMDVFRRSQTVMAYSSIGSEIDTMPLSLAVLGRGKTLLLPKVNPDAGALEAYEVKNIESDLRAGVWGIREPDPQICACRVPAETELILVPGVAFDRQGGRIGYGRGYYDKLLAACRGANHSPHAIAAAFEVQVVDAVPMEPHDVRIDMLVTEAGQWPERDL